MNEDKVLKLVELVKTSYEEAQKNRSKVSNDWRIMDQFSVSSTRFKNLLNNLCSVDNCCYLELGCFRGGTLMAALFGNKVLAAYAVDNFSYNPLSQYTDPATGAISHYNPEGWPNIRLNLIENLERLNLDKTVKVFMGDWNKISPTFIKHKLNVVHLDIEKNSQEILNFYDGKFDDAFVLVVSNYNEVSVREAVDNYVSSKNYSVAHKIVNYSSSNSDSSGWWNGLGILVIQMVKEAK